MGSLAVAGVRTTTLVRRGFQITMTINFGEEEGEELVTESFEARQAEAQKRRKKKKKTDRTLVASTFADLYKLTGETLGEGSYGKVETCVNIYTGLEYAVKADQHQGPRGLRQQGHGRQQGCGGRGRE